MKDLHVQTEHQAKLKFSAKRFSHFYQFFFVYLYDRTLNNYFFFRKTPLNSYVQQHPLRKNKNKINAHALNLNILFEILKLLVQCGHKYQ